MLSFVGDDTHGVPYCDEKIINAFFVDTHCYPYEVGYDIILPCSGTPWASSLTGYYNQNVDKL